MIWTAQMIGRVLARKVFARKYLIVVPNCNWTGNETDLLVITPDLRIIDVEIKISRADLKADAKKFKWYHNWDWKIDGEPKIVRDDNGRARRVYEPRRSRQWPQRVWKHYYALPESVWTPELAVSIQPTSGVIVLVDRGNSGVFARVVRRAKPCRLAEKIVAADAIDIARLASLRMWDAYDRLENRNG